jgi:FKBP-type peptidyl-prolyl cis-trans isomerase FklB
MQMKSLALAAAVMWTSQALADDATVFKDRKQQESYAIGAQTARTLRQDNVDIDVDMLMRGLRDGLSDGKLMMNEKELRAVMSRVQQELHKNMVTNRRTAGEKNKELGIQYLADNAKKPGVVTTDSGLQYRILKTGKGATPVLSDTVVVNYRGTLLDGSEFDASEDGKPSEFTASQTIAGWKEALQLMPVGSHWQIVMPPKLAYGDHGSGTSIGPNAVLVFDLDLVGIKKR